jgi:hypothetical protein
MAYYGMQVRWQQDTRAVHSNTLWHSQTAYRSWWVSLRLPLNSWGYPSAPAYNVWYQVLDGSLTFTGDLGKKTSKLLTAGISALQLAGAITKKTARAFSVTPLPFTGGLTKSTHRSLTGSLTFTGDLSRKVSKMLDGALVFSGNIFWKLLRAVTAGLTFAGALTTNFLPGTITKKGGKRKFMFADLFPEHVHQWLM